MVSQPPLSSEVPVINVFWLHDTVTSRCGWNIVKSHGKRQLSRLLTKPTKWPVRPAKTQINLGIRPVWSESSLSAWRKLGSLATYWAHSEDSDQTGRMPRLIWVFAGRTCLFVGFALRWLNYHQRTPHCPQYFRERPEWIFKHEPIVTWSCLSEKSKG